MSSLGAEAVSSCDDDRVETLFLFEAVAIETLASSGASSLNEFEAMPISPGEVKAQLKRLPASSAPGPD